MVVQQHNSTSCNIYFCMLRFDIKGTFLDACAFLRLHRLKFLIALAFVLVGGILGIMRALAIEEVARQSLMRFNLFLLIVGERTFWSYFFFRFFLLLIIVLGISLLGIRPILAWISLGILLLFVYQAAFFIALVFSYAGLVLLPLMLIVVVPLTLIFISILIFYISFILHNATCCAVTRFSDIHYFCRSVSKPFLATILILWILIIIEALLVFLLTLGVAV